MEPPHEPPNPSSTNLNKIWQSASPATPQQPLRSSVWGIPNSNSITPQVSGIATSGVSHSMHSGSQTMPGTPSGGTPAPGTPTRHPHFPKLSGGPFGLNHRNESVPASLAELAAKSEPVPSFPGHATMPSSAVSSVWNSPRLDPEDSADLHMHLGELHLNNNHHLDSNMNNLNAHSTTANSSSAEEIINTAIVVKNIPFAIKKEQLIEYMTQLDLPLPYAFNYHFDNGVFRGLAFANFANAEETAQVIKALNGNELNGRKLRVEYKKMLPYQERERIEREKRERRGQLEEQHKTSRKNTPAVSNANSPPAYLGTAKLQSVDFNLSANLDTYSSLLVFKHDKSKSELNIPATLAASFEPEQVSVIQQLCKQLGLTITSSADIGISISKRDTVISDLYLSGLCANAIAVPSTPPMSHINLNQMNPLSRWSSSTSLSSFNATPNYLNNQWSYPDSRGSIYDNLQGPRI